MDALQLTKPDLRMLLGICSLVPVLSFIAGFSIANHVPGDTTTTKSLVAAPGVVEPDSSSESRYGLNDSDAQVQSTLAVRSDASPAPVLRRYMLQAGLFKSFNNAIKFKESLHDRDLQAQIIGDSGRDGSVFRVVVGSYGSREVAAKHLQAIYQSHSVKLYISTVPAGSLSDLIALI